MRTHLDLFSGIGGFAVAAQACGYCTVGFCEKEPYAQQILKERFGAVLADTEKLQRNGGEHHTVCNSEKRGQIPELGNGGGPRLHSDIFTLNGADYAGVDLLTGGFPCQPFSVAGKQRGSADDRHLWPEMLRVIKECRPRWIIGENVAGFIKMELDNCISDLEAIGYTVRAFVIPACAVDAKHRRDRVWIVAHSERGAGGQGRTERRGAAGSGAHNEPSRPSEDVADAMRCGRPGQGKSLNAEHPTAARNGQATESWDGSRPAQWLPEPELGRVANGIPNRAHRLRGLGNAIVPQVAQEIIRAILTCDP